MTLSYVKEISRYLRSCVWELNKTTFLSKVSLRSVTRYDAFENAEFLEGEGIRIILTSFNLLYTASNDLMFCLLLDISKCLYSFVCVKKSTLYGLNRENWIFIWF